MKYNNEYQFKIFNDFQEQFADDVEVDNYSVEIDGVFNEPPVIKTCRLLDMLGPEKNGTDEFYEYQDLMTRYAILGKMVTLYLGDTKLGSFTLNGLSDNWGSIPMMAEHPKGYLAICNVAMSYLLKKYILPTKKKASTSEAEKSQG